MHVGPWPRRGVGDCAGQSAAFAGYDVTRDITSTTPGAPGRCAGAPRHNLRYGRRSARPSRSPKDSIRRLSRAGRRCIGRRTCETLKAKPESEWLRSLRDKAVAMMMNIIRDDLAALHVHHDVFFPSVRWSKARPIESGHHSASLQKKRRRL